ncbi:MAG: KdsC family phosphatase [Halanaerobiaceae bacterium]
MDIELLTKARKIKLFSMDVDGVLTDGRIIIGNQGQEFKAFHSQDGQGIKLLQEAGIRTAVITGRSSRLVEIRAGELDIEEVFQGIDNKLAVLRTLLKKHNLGFEEVACIGDDINDLPLLKKAGLAFTVADGVQEVKEEADFITSNRGGRGAVREVCDLLLDARRN